MKNVTAMIITLAMLCAVSCSNNTNGPEVTTGGTNAPAVTTGREDTSVTETTETTETVETTVAEETVDIEELLAGYTVYDVTTETYLAPLNNTDKPEKIALRFTDTDGLVLLLESNNDEQDYYVTCITNGTIIAGIDVSEGLFYSANGFFVEHENGTSVIGISGGLNRFSVYHIIKGNEYNVLKNEALDSGYALYVSVSDNGGLKYSKYNSKYHVYSTEEMIIAYESDDDFYKEYGSIVFENGEVVYFPEETVTFGEWYPNIDVFNELFEKYGVESFEELKKIYEQYIAE